MGYDGAHGGHEGVDIEHHDTRLNHVDGGQEDVGCADDVEDRDEVTPVVLQPGQLFDVHDGQRELRRVVVTRLDHECSVAASNHSAGLVELAGVFVARVSGHATTSIRRAVVYLLSIHRF